jgi:peptidoglycan L-alanyl-D-glutamate endopeptidase CwlK
MSRRLNDLAPTFRPLAVEFLARCVEAGIAVLIVDTLRTKEEQAENLRKGVSWTMNSRHLTGEAIDVCPFEAYALHGPDKLQWNASDPVWLRLGVIGEAVGLVWGGRWKVKDLGHFELPRTPDDDVRRA